MNNLMRQAKNAGTNVKNAGRVRRKTVEASAGGGVVTVVANGKKEIVEITIDPGVDPEDVEMLRLIMAQQMRR